MENPPIFKNGKPSISMGHLYHGELLVITRGHRAKMGGFLQQFCLIARFGFWKKIKMDAQNQWTMGLNTKITIYSLSLDDFGAPETTI